MFVLDSTVGGTFNRRVEKMPNFELLGFLKNGFWFGILPVLW